MDLQKVIINKINAKTNAPMIGAFVFLSYNYGAKFIILTLIGNLKIMYR